jgi:hypothetical protein
MRRVFIIRKDLHLKPGKLAAMVGHCAEAYFTNMLKGGQVTDNEFDTLLSEDPWRPGQPAAYKHPDVCRKAEKAFKAGEKYFKVRNQFPKSTMSVTVEIPKDIWNDYINAIFTKTICEARNLDNMKKRALPVIEELGLKEGVDYGYINDSCKTDLTPENPDGTCTVGMWFKPLPDEDAHKISKKFQLYRY